MFLSTTKNHHRCLLFNKSLLLVRLTSVHEETMLSVSTVLCLSVDKKSWSLERTRQLLSRKPFHYVALSREGQSITIAGEADFVFTFDSEQPLVSDEEKEAEKTGMEESNIDFEWWSDVHVKKLLLFYENYVSHFCCLKNV